MTNMRNDPGLGPKWARPQGWGVNDALGASLDSCPARGHSGTCLTCPSSLLGGFWQVHHVSIHTHPAPIAHSILLWLSNQVLMLLFLVIVMLLADRRKERT